MPKRKFANRRDWERILEHRYVQMDVHDEHFSGTVALFQIDAVRAPQYKQHNGEEFIVADAGYAWLQYFPDNEPFGVTVMFDDSGHIVQWYIDIVEAIGYEDGIPYMDDLLLDILVFPNGDVVRKDEDEFEEARLTGELTPELVVTGWRDFEQTLDRIERRDFVYFDLARGHYDELKQML
ncbi:DUF402 domain-containing protein [Exiguobacterium aurantiacum]|uniref:Protein of uncharacterized function (DUF402) n=1 Tax=Exiguobacterium aurantiacum TaxID=33987 RepID=A0A377FQ91_9BACL|nr:DUF402 domain-containing protein [Exiguobacterium aurantiacum]STO06868.1 Protein of uncharacterised function (DUF402) [Exiguobacterium aurantiacum]